MRSKKWIGWVVIAVAAVLAVVLIVVNVIGAQKMALLEEPSIEEEPPEEAVEITVEDWKPVEQELVSEVPEVPEVVSPVWHFYNSDIQNNGTAADDFNFGPNPVYENISLDRVKTAISGKSPSDTIKVEDIISEAEVEVMDRDFRERMRNDPALGAADMAWADSLLGTRYLGVFYDECEKEWDAAMNKAKEAWIADGEDYNKTLDAFFKYLDTASVEVRTIDKKLSDQMYMNPYTKDGVPDIVVLKTDDHSGWYLVYTFTIKETKKVEVMYRVDCGFQPTDVAKVMNVAPKTKSAVTGGGGGSVSGGGAISGGGGKTTVISGGGGNTPKPSPDPKPTPKPNPPKPDPDPKPTNPPKDPTQGTPVLPNDDPGPGPDTNTGPGGQYSSKDQPGNSNDLTPDEYKEVVKELEDANKDTGGGGDGSTPSTPPPSDDTHVDNPGASDDGHTDASDSSVADDAPGDSWDGPPD